MNDNDIASAFHQEMLSIYDQATEVGYRPVRFRQMVQEHGGLDTARRLLAMDGVASGITTLWEKGRLDLSTEALMLKPAYATLFTQAEREKARQTLAEYGYTAPWDMPGNDNTPAPDTPTPSLVERLARAVTHTQGDNNEENPQHMIAPNRPMTMAEAAYTILRKAGGGPLHLTNILEQALEQKLIEPTGQTPQLSLASIMLRDGRFNNLGKNMWVLAAPPNVTADQSDKHVPLPPDYIPQIYAGSEVSCFRIHFPFDLWPEAHERGLIAISFADQPHNQSVQRFKTIKPGDRIVAYVQKGRIGGVGVATSAAYDMRTAQHPTAAVASFDADYPQRIEVAWAEHPATPISLLATLQQIDHTRLYNRLRNPHTVMPLPRADYISVLALLQVDDPQPVAPSPSSDDWLAPSLYCDFIRSLDDTPYTADALSVQAQQFGQKIGITDPSELSDHLRQLRVLVSHDSNAETYQRQAYVEGNPAALLRLMTLAFLLPNEEHPETYTLPARAIVPRLRTTTASQPSDTFAPELGAYGPQLLAWYAEAALVRVDGPDWHALPDALEPLAGDDPATQMYNRFLRTLLAELDGVPGDLAHVPLDQPLPPITNLDARLHELSRDLIVDEQVVKRICRSLLAGRHVVLSGPPGTGKTELAMRLPALLWREDARTFTYLTTSLDALPVATRIEQRHGYAVELVTATEDWGVRDVVGGIGPRLDGDGSSGTLRYVIEYGHLTRTVLRHFANTNDGRTLQPTLTRRDYRDNRDKERQRYRGIWLVIDEFTRAPIDAAFGSLLTTLSGGEQATLSVPTPGGIERPVRLPHDFRIIGTLNSFDRHFLNQMSEALKRRFDFIDVLPPHPRHEAYEQGIAVKQALQRLHATGLVAIRSAGTPQSYHWQGVISAQPDTNAGLLRYTWQAHAEDARAALESFWQIFRAIRVFRQLGTAQAVAVYANLFTGRMLTMSWAETLDTALADTLADQLQVLARDEQRTLDAYIEHAGNAEAFTQAVAVILKELPVGRRASFLYALREASRQRHGETSITLDGDTAPTTEQLAQVFALGQPLQLPTPGAFRSRLHDLIGERGL